MVETSIDKNTHSATIVLKPNNSSSWQFNMRVLSSLAIIAFLLSFYCAFYFSFQSLWLILAFGIFEISFVFTCLYLRVRANNITQVITFDENTVRVEHGHYHAEQCWKYHRMWAKIFVKKPTIRGYPKKIFICCHGKELELGAFLNTKDKERLIKDLKAVIYA